VRNPQTNPAILTWNPETSIVNIRLKDPFGPVVSVRDVVSRHRPLAGYLADSSHCANLVVYPVKGAFYNRFCAYFLGE